MVAANDGNFSVKISSEEILCTPTGVSKGFMSPDMICKVDLEGRVLQSDGIHKPSSEIKMHLRIYQRLPDVNAVVHAHPMYATVYAVLGRPLAKQLMPEATLSFGEVPIARYGLPPALKFRIPWNHFSHLRCGAAAKPRRAVVGSGSHHRLLQDGELGVLCAAAFSH